MKREAILGLLAIVAICSVVFIAGCNEWHTPTPTPPANTKTYDKFGFSFDYPADMIIDKQLYGIIDEPNEVSGTIVFRSTTKPESLIVVVTWGLIREGEDTSDTALEEAVDSRLASSDIICQAKGEKRSHLGHTVIERRYVLNHKLRGGDFATVRSDGTWYCDKSKKSFIVGASRSPKDAGIKVDNGHNTEMLPLEKDPVYKDYREIIDSFRCH